MADASSEGTLEGRSSTNTLNINRQQLIIDESLLSRLVADRLNLPMSQRLVDRYFLMAIVRKCWEDQLRFKGRPYKPRSYILII